MYRLSIIIPVPSVLDAVDAAEPAAFEETLVSVLENRPANCEVMLACDPSYDDPYDLGDEVEFVTATENRWTTLANLALDRSQGRFTHLLMPGVTVAADWQRDACDQLSRSSDSMVGVSPRIEYETNDCATAGIKLTPCGRRRYLRTEHVEGLAEEDQVVFGPCRQAGFFRRDELLRVGGWNEGVHASVADIELALRLRSRGFHFAYCEGSSVQSHPSTGIDGLATRSSFSIARDLERIYRAYSRSKVIPQRGLGVTLRMLAGIGSDSVFGRMAGRFGDVRMDGSISIECPVSEEADSSNSASMSRAA